MEDLDYSAGRNGILEQLKIWCDRYEFTAEWKGGSRDIKLKGWVTTSNYTPRELAEYTLGVENSEELVKSIERRFRVVTIKDFDDADTLC